MAFRRRRKFIGRFRRAFSRLARRRRRVRRGTSFRSRGGIMKMG